MRIARWNCLWMLGVIVALCGAPAHAQLGQCAVPIGPHRPDLIVDGELLKTQIFLTEEKFSGSSCTVKEGCVTRPGNHLVLRFMSSTPNIGKADLYIGDPNQCPNLFQQSECHQHLHFKEYADYRVWTEEGYRKWVAFRDLSLPTNTGLNARLLEEATANGELVVGRKQGFCVVDIVPFPTQTIKPGPPVYQSCSTNQGLSVGWADQYGPQLACQFVQVTDLTEGIYVLEDHVNPEQLFPESDYTNNTAAVRFLFKPKRGNTPASIQVLDP